MRKEYQMLIVLTAIIGFAGGILAYTYVATKSDIEKNANNAKKKALTSVVSGTSDFEEKVIDDKTTILIAKDSQGSVLGYGVLITGAGFQGPIKLMVGFAPDGSKVLGIEVIENSETPGLGNRIVESWFKEQFKGTIPPISVVKGRKPETTSEIQAITGATISSRSVANIVNKAKEVLDAFLKGGLSESFDSDVEGIVKENFPSYKLEKKGEVYVIHSSDSGEIVGYGAFGKALGYEDTIQVFLITDNTGLVAKDIRVLKGAEFFSNQVKFSKVLENMKNKKYPLNLKEVNAVSGATITQDAFVSAVNQAFEKIKKELK